MHDPTVLHDTFVIVRTYPAPPERVATHTDEPQLRLSIAIVALPRPLDESAANHADGHRAGRMNGTSSLVRCR